MEKDWTGFCTTRKVRKGSVPLASEKAIGEEGGRNQDCVLRSEKTIAEVRRWGMELLTNVDS
jgi:hypothetical protein